MCKRVDGLTLSIDYRTSYEKNINLTAGTQRKQGPAVNKKGFSMTDTGETILINANIEISVTALQTIVDNAKKAAGRDAKGHYRVDTADKVSEMISRFLMEKDFEGYVNLGD